MEKNPPSKRDSFIHPQLIMIYLILAGVTTLFVGMAIGYMYTRVQNQIEPIRLPWLFFISTIVLFFSGTQIKKTQEHFENDNRKSFLKGLKFSTFLTVLFFLLQIIGWYELLYVGNSLTDSPLSSYVYVMSGTHLAHVLLGLPFLLIFYFRAKKKLKDGLPQMLYFADPDHRRHLRLLRIYWIFLDRLWIILMVFFWANWAINDFGSVLPQ